MGALRDPVTGHVVIPQLFHYTCDHGRDAILADGGMLRPGFDGFVWMTDLDVPYRVALGLTSQILSCDRTAHRFELVMPEWNDTPPWPAVPWMELRKMRGFKLMAYVLEAAGTMPRHWFVSSRPVLAVAS